MKVLITGVSGFVGSGLVDYLQSIEGVSLVGHGRNQEALEGRFSRDAIQIIPSYSAEIFDELEISCIVHLAGIAHDLSNKYKTEDYREINFKGTESIFREFVKSKATSFIFLSSIKACVDSSDFPVNEEAIPTPLSDYGKSKQLAEQSILSQPLSGAKRAYILRPCMIHGRGNKGNLNILYKYVRSGLPYFFGAYSNQRPFLTAENLNFIILQFVKKEFPSGIYHLADKGNLSTPDLIRLICSCINKNPRIWSVSPRVLDVFFKLGSRLGLPFERMKQKLTESLIVSTSKIEAALGEPLPVDLKTGLQTTLKSFDE
ncbi:NAD-dependent epimerase/dehydratase family protein [soil metagenome]